jgi:PAS domain S-box-containing protein
MPTHNDPKIDAGDIPADILIVDDEIPNLQLLCELLGKEGYQVRPANNPKLAIESALAQPPSLILLDVRMPEMDGFEVCRRLKQEERTCDIPVLFVSALQDVQDRVLGFEAGGLDFISKPFQEAEILARVRTHLELRNMQLNLEKMVAKRTAELAESEARYRSLVENALVGVFNSTLDGRFTFVNDAMARMFDFDTPEQMIAQGALGRWRDQKDRERMLAEFQQQGEVTNFEAETTTHTDRKIDVIFSAKQIGNDIFGMVMDITRRKRIEKELQKSYDLLKHLLSSIPDTVFSVRLPERVVEWAEDSYNTMGLGQNPRHVQGQSTQKYFASPEDYKNFGEIQRQAIREGKRYMRTEVMLCRKDGTHFPAEVTGTFYKENGEVKRITALARDITDRKQAEQKLLDYQQRLKALASQLTIAEEKERRVIATDLHDHVGQSLALARLQLASARKMVSESTLADTLADVSNTLLNTLEDTQLLMLKLSSSSMHETGFSAAISEWLETQIGNRYSLKTEFIDNIPDNRKSALDENVRTLLFRNVRELVVNVVKHAHAKKVSVRLEDRSSNIRIIVEDDGIGFEPHAVIHGGRKIGGFGLFSIEELMADLGGNLKIVSEPGKGCTAILSAPFSVDDG